MRNNYASVINLSKTHESELYNLFERGGDDESRGCTRDKNTNSYDDWFRKQNKDFKI